MNYWTQESIKFASQRNYLDELFKIYPLSPNVKRGLDSNLVSKIEKSFVARDEQELIRQLLKLELFPVKDCYVAYLKRDKSSIERNPNTVKRLASYMFDMGLTELLRRAEEPKETNRQMGQLFRNWIAKEFLGVKVCRSVDEFMSNKDNAILNVPDSQSKKFATKYLGYGYDKGIDFIARMNNKYVVGEAKFLTDFGGHQSTQFLDAITVMQSKFLANELNAEIIPIAILDGVLFIEGNTKMYKYITNDDNKVIISSLLLREFLFSL